MMGDQCMPTHTDSASLELTSLPMLTRGLASALLHDNEGISMSNQQQETKQESVKPDLPFLRALKCAYKLHKAGLTPLDVRCYLSEADDAIGRGDPLPSAATPVVDILSATFNFADSLLGDTYWSTVQRRLEAA